MGGILGSRYAQYFKGVVLLNPALNIPLMYFTSDIPDWCFSSALS